MSLKYFVLRDRKCSVWIPARELRRGVLLCMNTSKIFPLCPESCVHLHGRQLSIVHLESSGFWLCENCVLVTFFSQNSFDIVEIKLIWSFSQYVSLNESLFPGHSTLSLLKGNTYFCCNWLSCFLERLSFFPLVSCS